VRQAVAEARLRAHDRAADDQQIDDGAGRLSPPKQRRSFAGNYIVVSKRDERVVKAKAAQTRQILQYQRFAPFRPLKAWFAGLSARISVYVSLTHPIPE
jgi:hypothetical protein